MCCGCIFFIFITLFTDQGTAKRVKLSEIAPLTRAKKGSTIIKSPKTKKYNVMKVENNVYESPKLETTEIIVEQAILTASGGDYPDWNEELPL